MSTFCFAVNLFLVLKYENFFDLTLTLLFLSIAKIFPSADIVSWFFEYKILSA